MDSLSQFVLGAAIGTALLAPKIGARKAVLVGGALGTLPDLDVLIGHIDPVDNFILHRGFSHSLIIHALAAPVLGEGLRHMFQGLRDARMTAWAVVFLCLSTHALLDAMTIYGTQLLWPYTHPFGVGSMFIIDPLYTIPLLVAVIWALIAGGHGRGVMRASGLALALSTGYLGWSVVAQKIVEARADRILAASGIVPAQRMATPVPFTTLAWKAMVIDADGDRYFNLYMPLFGSVEVTEIHGHRRNLKTLGCGLEGTGFDRLAAFSKGYFMLREEEGKIILADLRMGLTPGYSFQFALRGPDGPLQPTQRVEVPRQADGDIDWLTSLIAGHPAGRSAEGPIVALADLAPAAPPKLAIAGETLGGPAPAC